MTVRIASSTPGVGVTPPLEGTKAAMPVANTVPARTIYFATDDNGGTCYRSDGVTSTASPAGWAKIAAGALETGGRELGYAELAANFTRTAAGGNQATANTDYDLGAVGLTTTVTVGARPIDVLVAIPLVTHSVANSSFQIKLFEDGVVKALSKIATSAASEGGGGVLHHRPNPAPSAGSHTYAVKFRTNAAGDVTLFAGAGTLTWPNIQVKEA